MRKGKTSDGLAGSDLVITDQSQDSSQCKCVDKWEPCVAMYCDKKKKYCHKIFFVHLRLGLNSLLI